MSEDDVYLLDDEKYICKRCANFVIKLSVYKNRYGYKDYEAICSCNYKDVDKFLHCDFGPEKYRVTLLQYLANNQEETI